MQYDHTMHELYQVAFLHIYLYVYICIMYVCMYVCIYIYIVRAILVQCYHTMRELYQVAFLHVYLYVCMYVCESDTHHAMDTHIQTHTHTTCED